MGSFLHTGIFFILSLGILVFIHEFGHFWVARKLDVKVLRFSLGFGKSLWRTQKTPDSTEFVVAAIPLGGYVKMVDEREGEVLEKDLPYAFNRQPLLSRVAIVLAGPVFNLLLAIFLYWAVFMLGESGIRPVLGSVPEGTFAAQAGISEGDEILSVSDQSTPTWSLALTTLFTETMDKQRIPVVVKRPDGTTAEHVLDIPEDIKIEPKELQDKLGFTPWKPALKPILNEVVSDEAADKAGFLSGDQVISIDGVEMTTWEAFVKEVKNQPGRALSVGIERDGVLQTLTLTPAVHQTGKGEVGRIGATVRVPPELLQTYTVKYQLGVMDAFIAAVNKTVDFSFLTLKMIGRMATGSASVENLSGPIGIAKIAGESANMGIVAFLKFLAIISISLGVLNLLPIPMLDGGHLFFYLIEAIKGSPLSDNAMALGQQVGMAVLMGLMGLAIFLDIGRLFT